MNGAITELQVVRKKYWFEEAAYRSERNIEQADFCAKRIADIDEAIGVLEKHDRMGCELLEYRESAH